MWLLINVLIQRSHEVTNLTNLAYHKFLLFVIYKRRNLCNKFKSHCSNWKRVKTQFTYNLPFKICNVIFYICNIKAVKILISNVLSCEISYFSIEILIVIFMRSQNILILFFTLFYLEKWKYKLIIQVFYNFFCILVLRNKQTYIKMKILRYTVDKTYLWYKKHKVCLKQ